MTLSLYEGISIEVSSTVLRTNINCLSERHLKINVQTARSWLQQNARLLARATCKLIPVSYSPCVAIYFPWHTNTDVASSSCRETTDP